jgi:hypothetical protein
MVLTEKQSDAIGELINIAFARTASSLSEMSGYRVLLDAPTIDIQPIGDLPHELGAIVNEEVATVHQIFSGPRYIFRAAAPPGEPGPSARIDHDRFGRIALCCNRFDGVPH